MTSIQPNAPTNPQTIVQPKQPETKQKEKSSISTGVKVAVGAGLTALAAAGIYIATKGKGGKNVSKEIESLTQLCRNYLSSHKFKFDSPQIGERLEEISKLPKKERLEALRKLHSTLDHTEVVKNYIDLERKLPKRPNLPKGMTTLPDDVRQAYEQKDVIKTGELFKQHLDKLPNTRPAVTKGATVAESIENTFGKGSNIQPHTYDLSQEHPVITIYRDSGGFKYGIVSKEGRYDSCYNILNEAIPDSKFALKSANFSSQGCVDFGKGTSHCYDTVLTIDGEKRRVVRISIPDPTTHQGETGRYLDINLLSQNEELTSAQKDLLKLGKNPEKIDIPVIDKLTTVAETRQDHDNNLYKYLDYDVLLSSIQSMAKRV